MGKRRRAAKKVVKKKRPTVAKVFKCLFCNHEKAVSCSLDHKSMTGELSCGICEAKYQTHINSLTEPIDVFTDWLDETAELQEQEARVIAQNRRAQHPNSNFHNDADVGTNEIGRSQSPSALDVLQQFDTIQDDSKGETGNLNDGTNVDEVNVPDDRIASTAE